MKLDLIQKMSEKGLLLLKKGDVFYHVNPFGRKAGSVPTVEKYTLTSDWYEYHHESPALNGSLRVNVSKKIITEVLGLRVYETSIFLDDYYGCVKGNFLKREDALRYALYCSSDYEVIEEVKKHHNRCDDLFRGF